MVTELQRIAERRQCGNDGKETPRRPIAMVRFGNHNRIKDSSLLGSRLGESKRGRKVIRAILHNAKRNRKRTGLRVIVPSPPVSCLVQSSNGRCQIRPPA